MSLTPVFEDTRSQSRYDRREGGQWHPPIRVNMAIPWILQSLGMIDRLENLRENWDGYGSSRIQPGALAAARKLVASVGLQDLPTPHVCPVSGGCVGLAWQVRNKELELTVHPNGSIEYLVVRGPNLEREDSMQEGVLPAECYDDVKKWMEWLLNP